MQAINLSQQTHNLQLSDTVIIESYDIFEDFNSLGFELSYFSKQEILRQAFKVFDDPQLKLGTAITTIVLNSLVDTNYLLEQFQPDQLRLVNQLFQKIILTLYFRCYENKLFVGSNYPTVPSFPYFLENIDIAGCVLKLDRTYL